jgi:hypothetical protein
VHLAKSIATYVATKLKGYDEKFQQLVFEKVLGCPILKGMLPLYLTNVSIAKKKP